MVLSSDFATPFIGVAQVWQLGSRYCSAYATPATPATPNPYNRVTRTHARARVCTHIFIKKGMAGVVGMSEVISTMVSDCHTCATPATPMRGLFI